MSGRFVLILAVAGGIFLTGCGEGPATEGDAPAATRQPADFDGSHDEAVLAMERLGEIRIELLPEVAPESVRIFSERVEARAYDGTTFHRVVPGFMIQGGSPSTRKADPRHHGRGGVADFPDEFSDVTFARGAVGLANKKRRGSAHGQFFIVLQDSPQLDGVYTLFGRVSAGMDVVDAIAELEIDKFGRYGPQDRPHPRDARILSIRIDPSEGGS
jgi:cyclophilin family peptidyl-prolyl cis-trans isomerase